MKNATLKDINKNLEKYDLSKIPTITQDLNTSANAGFFGVFRSFRNFTLL